MRPPPDQFADALAHADWVRHLARSLVSEADAEDLAQDTWEATLRAEGTTHRGWLGGVLRNHAALKHRTTARRLRREVSALVTEAPPSADVMLERLELQRLLSTLVSELPEGARLFPHLSPASTSGHRWKLRDERLGRALSRCPLCLHVFPEHTPRLDEQGECRDEPLVEAGERFLSEELTKAEASATIESLDS